jgi:hypothetical protein
MLVALDGTWPRSGVFRPASGVARPVAAGFWGGRMKTRDLVFLITLPIGLLIGVSMLCGLADTELAQFIDHLAMSGIIAYGVVYSFFM